MGTGEKQLGCGNYLEPSFFMVSLPFRSLLGRHRDRAEVQRTMNAYERRRSSTREPKSERKRKRGEEAGDSLDRQEGIMLWEFGQEVKIKMCGESWGDRKL